MIQDKLLIMKASNSKILVRNIGKFYMNSLNETKTVKPVTIIK